MEKRCLRCPARVSGVDRVGCCSLACNWLPGGLFPPTRRAVLFAIRDGDNSPGMGRAWTSGSQ
jgi:hypothetical protein